MDRLTQCEMIIRYIKEFGSITTLQAFRDIGCTRLASRINDLKNQGYKFKDEFVTSKNRYGATVSYKRYYLDSGGTNVTMDENF